MKNKVLCILLSLVLLCLAGVSLAQESSSGEQYETKISDLAHSRIGVVTGGLQAIYLPQMLPEAEFVEFNQIADAAMALTLGKIDSFSAEESTYMAMRREGQPFIRLDEPFMVSEYGVLFSKGSDPKLLEQFNAFLAESTASGVLAELTEKWFGETEPTELLTTDHLTGENGTIHYVTSSSVKPYAFIKNGQITGFDTEMMILFAQSYGYRLNITDTSFGGVLTGIEQGKYDMAAAGVTITEERRKSITFSDPYYREDVVMIVLDEGTAEKTYIADYATARIGVTTGSVQAQLLPKLLPQAVITEYNTVSDAAMAMSGGRLDAFATDESIYLTMKREGMTFIRVDEPLMVSEYGMLLGKNTAPELLADFNRFLQESVENGLMAQLKERWFGETEPEDLLACEGFTGEKGRILYAIEPAAKPFAYVKNNQLTGFDVELMIHFARAYGYELVIEDTTFGGLLTGIEQGRYDMAGSGITITEERKETMTFSDTYHTEDIVLVVPSAPAAGTDSGASSLMASLAESFEKTFIREDRWKLIVEGLDNTLLISVCSVAGGSIFGFALYMLARMKNRVISGATKVIVRIYSRLIAGTPTLVVLMLLFYVVFGKSDVDGLWVAILGFLLTFGAFVYGHLMLCVEGVDRGQTEAAYALGYTRNQTFFRIILPQSMKSFLPTYTGEVVGLIKATSVVGYIAVSDLTKMGDIIRSNTYEALFPLIAVAVIYFIITWGAAALLGLVQKKLDNHKRKSKNILKGVVR